MPLDWANARYVRLYKPTPDHALLPWQGQLIWPRVVQAADGAGVIHTTQGALGVWSAMGIADLPRDVVDVGVAALLSDGCLVATASGYLVRNYVEAQTTKSTDTARKARQRERDRAQDAMSHAVTHGRGASESVTPIRAEPIRAEILNSHTVENGVPARGKPRPKPDLATPEERAAVTRILERVGRRTGIKYRAGDHHVRLIARHLRAGVTEWELRGIVGYCWFELGWADKPEMHPYLRPETLYGPQTIHRYLDGARAWLAKHYPNGPEPEPETT